MEPARGLTSQPVCTWDGRRARIPVLTHCRSATRKAILAVRPEVRRPDPRALGEFVACGCVLENRTLFDGIRVMPSSSAWVFRHGALEKKHSYFHPREWEQQSILEPEPYYRQVREV